MSSLILKNYFINCINIIITLIGFLFFKITKKTPNFFYQSYVRSYCFTNSRTKNLLTKFCQRKNFQEIEMPKSKILDKSVNYSKVLSDIEKNGYHVFDTKISEQIVNDILNFSLNVECDVYDDNGELVKKKFKSRDEIISSKYEIPVNRILENKQVRQIINDYGFLKIANLYFKTQPILSDVSMWWSPVRNYETNENIEKKNRSAQMFHFDLDRICWLKLFIYLTDTDETSGPHEYIEKSHKVGSKPKDLLSKGYNRISENIIKQHYSSSNIKKICGSKGTMFIGDTSCYHRGQPPKENDRLMLVIEFSNSLFGASQKKIDYNLKF